MKFYLCVFSFFFFNLMFRLKLIILFCFLRKKTNNSSEQLQKKMLAKLWELFNWVPVIVYLVYGMSSSVGRDCDTRWYHYGKLMIASMAGRMIRCDGLCDGAALVMMRCGGWLAPDDDCDRPPLRPGLLPFMTMKTDISFTIKETPFREDVRDLHLYNLI